MTHSKRIDPQPIEGPMKGIFAYAVETKAETRMLHLAGQVGVPSEGETPADFRGQCRQAILNVEMILHAADMSLEDIVKMTFYLTRREDIEALLDVRLEMLDGVRPAVTTLIVAGLFDPDWLIEVDVVAAKIP